MSDSDSETEAQVEYIFYKDRPEWSDVTPVPQDDGPNPVVAIAYTEKFKDVYDYFRAVLKNDERSERAFELTTDAALLNPANYTVWHFRRVLLKSLNKDLKKELDFSRKIIKDHAKNYQIWCHRQKIIGWLNDPLDELTLTEAVLGEDAKNYHAWQYRQWVITTFSLWDKELDYVHKLLMEDIRNNSAWNQRHFVIAKTTGYTSEVLSTEVKYTMDFLRRAPSNESAWNYLEGIFKGHQMSTHPGLKEFCAELQSLPVPSPPLLCFMVSLYEEEASLHKDTPQGKQSLDNALQICQQLADKVDTIRKLYWEYTAKRLTGLFGTVSS
ncbi:protein farnesyltransferase/geranylgeranyltransferase type-1 subunit alpha-like [Dysidea avara]|uniref:protein farnesyltransferase/geranylgeranyltransferase type-1 subunit alpha-like n=1 Tax=Dysidea avara TaxID=196820 RepID=UPI003324DA46